MKDNYLTKTLPKEVEAIKDFVDPLDSVKDGEHVIGTASDYLKKVYTLSRRKHEEAEFIKRSILSDLQSGLIQCLEEHEKFAEGSEIDFKAGVIINFFWLLVKEEFQIWHRENIGIRKGYQVVWYDEEQPSGGGSIEELLSALAGRGGGGLRVVRL